MRVFPQHPMNRIEVTRGAPSLARLAAAVPAARGSEPPRAPEVRDGPERAHKLQAGAELEVDHGPGSGGHCPLERGRNRGPQKVEWSL